VEDPMVMHVHSRHSTHEVELQNDDFEDRVSHNPCCGTTDADGWTPLHSWKQHDMWRMVVTKAPEECAFKCTTQRWAKE